VAASTVKRPSVPSSAGLPEGNVRMAARLQAILEQIAPDTYQYRNDKYAELLRRRLAIKTPVPAPFEMHTRSTFIKCCWPGRLAMRSTTTTTWSG
jgi:hypothetical protein